MYSRPSVQRFGTLRELTLGGSANLSDLGFAANNSCSPRAPFCYQAVPNPRS